MAIVLLAGVVRLIVPLSALAVHGNPQVFFSPDTNSYVRPAQALVEHGSFTTTPGGSVEIRRTPGYPLLLTLGVLADRIAAVTIAVQILLGTATVWMVALLARRVIGAGTGDASHFSLWAAAAYALDPLSILYPSLLLTETLFTAVFVVHLLALLRFLETRAVGTAALAGVLAAASTFVRPVAYFWPFVATAIMLCTLRRAGIRGCATFLVLAVLPCVLWAVRNDVQGGYFGFSAIRDRNLYSYNAAAVLARIEGARFDDVRTRLDARLEELEEAGGLDTYAKRAEYMGREGLRIIRDHPVAFLEVHLSGIVRVIIDPGFTQYLRLYGGQRMSGLTMATDHGLWTAFTRLARGHPTLLVGSLAFLVVVVIQLSLFALGVVRVWRTRTLVAMVLLGAVAYFLVVSGGPIGHSRFRHPMMPIICIFAGVGLVSERRSGHGPTRETFSTRSG